MAEIIPMPERDPVARIKRIAAAEGREDGPEERIRQAGCMETEMWCNDCREAHLSVFWCVHHDHYFVRCKLCGQLIRDLVPPSGPRPKLTP